MKHISNFLIKYDKVRPKYKDLKTADEVRQRVQENFNSLMIVGVLVGGIAGYLFALVMIY